MLKFLVSCYKFFTSVLGDCGIICFGLLWIFLASYELLLVGF